MWDLTRREWLASWLSLAGAGFAAQLPAQFSTPATPPCDPSTKPTPGRPAKGFQAGAPFRQVITGQGAGQPVSLEGAVIGLRCGLIAGAVVDFWSGGARGRQRTDAGGRFHVTAPLTQAAGTARRLNVRIDVPGKATLTTYLFLPDEVAHAENAKDPGFDPLLQMKLVSKGADAIHASFNIILDL